MRRMRLRESSERHALLTSMLRPRSIAVLGASAKRKASGNEALLNLLASGFPGALTAVHREAPEINGVAAVPRIEDLPRDLDVALVSLPAPAVVPALRALAGGGCRSAVVPTIGLSKEDTAAYVELARSVPMAIHGPNSMGLLNYTDSVPLWFDEGQLADVSAGSTALVAQSGSACLFIVRAAPRLGFSKVISSGNELGIPIGEYLSWLADDPATERVGVVIESLRDVDGFAEAVAKLRAAGKPIVALKAGRSRDGMAATIAHTGALIGAAAAYDNLFHELDVPTVADYDEMATSLECLASEHCTAAGGSRVAVVTISGGQAAMAADLAEAKDVPLARLSEGTAQRLLELAPGAVAGNPFDIGASLAADETGYADCLEALALDPGVDTVLVVLDAAHTLSDVEICYARNYFAATAEAATRRLGKPIIIASSSSLGIHPACRAWTDGVPVLRGIGNALVAARSIARNQAQVAPGDAGYERPPEYDELRSELLDSAGTISHDTGRRLLHAYRVPIVESVLAADAPEAVRAAEEMGFPVVVKVASPDIAHRSEVGGVIPGLNNGAEVRDAVEGIIAAVAGHAPGLRIEGFEVQRHLTDSLEATIGFISDPVFGATVMLGSGGTLVELMADTVAVGASLTREAARRALERTRLARVAAGYRGLIPVTPLDGLVDTVVAVARLAADFSDILTEGDLNPVLVEHRTGRVSVVDALLVAGANPSQPDARPENRRAEVAA